MDPSHSGKRVLWSDESVFQVIFWEEWNAVCSGPKKKGSSRLIPATKSKSQGLSVPLAR